MRQDVYGGFHVKSHSKQRKLTFIFSFKFEVTIGHLQNYVIKFEPSG